MVTFPTETPVTIPEDEPIDAIPGLLLVQVPTVATSDKVTELPGQTFVVEGVMESAVFKETMLEGLPFTTT